MERERSGTEQKRSKEKIETEKRELVWGKKRKRREVKREEGVIERENEKQIGKDDRMRE